MEVPGGYENKCLVCLYEVMGTAVLILAIDLSMGNPLAIGLLLLCAIACFDRVCGAHFNPAVSIAVLLKEGKMSNILFFLMIVLSEIVGATLGVIIAYACQYPNPETN